MKLLLFCSLISRITCWLNVIWDACVCVWVVGGWVVCVCVCVCVCVVCVCVAVCVCVWVVRVRNI